MLANENLTVEGVQKELADLEAQCKASAKSLRAKRRAAETLGDNEKAEAFNATLIATLMSHSKRCRHLRALLAVLADEADIAG